tara:strand:- start:592 stop:1098 length:507 start_codon:yes stop_codon:yes gene_type:complete
MNCNFYYLIILPLFLFNLGCNVYSFTGSSIPKNAKTVYIEEVINNTPLSNPELSNLFTEKLNNYILKNTNLKTSNENPDLIFKGQIIKYDINPISINSQNNASQNRLSIEIEIYYYNQEDSLNNFNKNFANYADFNSSDNFLDIETELNEQIVDKLIEDIFLASFSNW